MAKILKLVLHIGDCPQTWKKMILRLQKYFWRISDLPGPSLDSPDPWIVAWDVSSQHARL